MWRNLRGQDNVVSESPEQFLVEKKQASFVLNVTDSNLNFHLHT